MNRILLLGAMGVAVIGGALVLNYAINREETLEPQPAPVAYGRGGRMSLPPVLFVIDDDAGTTHALRDDLARRFGEDFRVIGETSAPAGLSALRGLAELHQPVALLIVDDNLSACF